MNLPKPHILIPSVTLAAVILLIILVKIFTSGPPSPEDAKVARVYIRDVPIAVHIADSLYERTQGLSGKTSLPEDSGLFFIFDRPGLHGIWMRNMLFPIDVVWIGEDLRVVSVKERMLPESFPTTYSPDELALYVLEVNAGFVASHGLLKGDPVRLDL